MKYGLKQGAIKIVKAIDTGAQKILMLSMKCLYIVWKLKCGAQLVLTE
jgi:hypothetical protein